jgi:hypothetical protein
LFAGGTIGRRHLVVLFRKLDVWIETVRAEQSQPSWAEWFQWLAEHFQSRKNEARPAYLAYKGWRAQ